MDHARPDLAQSTGPGGKHILSVDVFLCVSRYEAFEPLSEVLWI